MKNVPFLKKISIVDCLAILFCLLFTVAGILVSLHRYWQFDVFYYDFGIFDSAIWNVSRLQPPIIDHLSVGGKWIFADHFSPSIFILSLLYWFTNKSEVLLIAQALCVGLSGLVLYDIGKIVLKNRIQSFCILGSYFLFAGLQNGVIFDFHEVTIMTLPLMLTFWAIVKKNLSLYIICFLLSLGFKESTFALGVGIAIVVFFTRKEWRKIAIFSAIASLLWGVIAIKIVIPYFSGGVYQYNPVFRNGLMGLFTGFFDNKIKRETLWYSFLNFGFLSLFSPMFWFLLLQDFAIRFLPDVQTRWGLGFHYSVQTTQLLALSSTYGLRNIRNKFPSLHVTSFCVFVLFISLFLYRFPLRGSLALAYNPAFYKHTKDFAFLNDLVTYVPKNVSVMAQNNIAVRFTHQKVFLLRRNYGDYMPDYIVMDMREGQNPNNFYVTINPPLVLYNLKELDKNYSLVHNTGEQYIFKRIKK
jgi:uncharacterized membrane protein